MPLAFLRTARRFAIHPAAKPTPKTTAFQSMNAIRSLDGIVPPFSCASDAGFSKLTLFELVKSLGQPQKMRLAPAPPMPGCVCYLMPHNHRRLRRLGITPRSSIDVLIGTFCAEHDHSILNCEDLS